MVTRNSGRRGLGEGCGADLAVLSWLPRGMSGCSRALPVEFLFLCFISFFSVRGELASGSLEEWVIVESEKSPLFRRCRPHEPYAESLLLRDMAQAVRVCGRSGRPRAVSRCD